MTIGEFLDLIKDVDKDSELLFRPAYMNHTKDIKSIRVVRGAVVISDEKELYTYEEALKYAERNKCASLTCNCFQCRYITFKKGETCADVYVERNFEKIIQDDKTYYKLIVPETNKH